VKQGIHDIVAQMTLQEKCAFVCGLDKWHTEPIERLGIPSIMMTDGPHGLRKIVDDGHTVQATCFPAGAGLASSWNRDLIKQVGAAIGEEAQAEEIAIVLGPAANIKRSPLCGRNFEYLSEDPYLTGEMAKSHIQGVQSQNVGTSLKHFCANNQETMRMRVDEIIDERALREIYLAGFETAVKEAAPATVMCSYNSVNGTPLACNKRFLTDVLREEWGFDGFVVSDWGAIKQRAECVAAGLDLEMPGTKGTFNDEIEAAVLNGTLPEAKLDEAVEHILSFVLDAAKAQKKGASYSKEEHDRFAREAAAECMVLLKNEDGLLPFDSSDTIAVIGAFAETPRFQGGGSSHIQPNKTTSLLDALKEQGRRYTYSKGFSLESDELDEALAAEALDAARKAGIALVMAGLPAHYESEGYDRVHMQLPPNQNKLIARLCAEGVRVAVVLSNGSPVELPWADWVDSILEAYLGGQASGAALADLLYGEANPSGRLAETFPMRLQDNPSYLNFPGAQNRVEYRESVFVGYRYYEKKELGVRFPFGHGLSYTSFAYETLRVSKERMNERDLLSVSVTVRNTGKRPGQEVVQLYIAAPGVQANRPYKELKGFEKVSLAPGECKTVLFELDGRSFSYFDEYENAWMCEPGMHGLLIGSSSADIRLKGSVELVPERLPRLRVSPYMTVKEVLDHPKAGPALSDRIWQLLSSHKTESEDGALNPQMIDAMLREMPLASLAASYPEQFTQEVLEDLLSKLKAFA
jgi:beta-glucosidase